MVKRLPIFSLVILFLLLVSTSAGASEAAIATHPARGSRSHYVPTSALNLSNTPTFTYLPLSLDNFHPKCPGIPNNLLALFGPSLVAYYPLWELGGNTVVDVSPNKRNGVYEGHPALNRVPALCGSAPSFDGVDDIADVYSPGLASAFNGDEGTAIIQLKIEPGEWVDGKESFYLALRANSTNNIVFYKSANNQLHFAYTANGIKQAATYNDLATDKWVTYAITWSKSNDRFLGYMAGESICPEPVELEGNPICPPQKGLGEWSAELTSAEIGGYLGSVVSYAKGSISSFLLLDREATPDEIREYSAIFGAQKVLTILGDSISRVFYSSPWPVQTVLEYGGGNQVTLKSHAVSARGILLGNGMDDQTVAARFDDADIIIIALGVVDDNEGDMDSLKAEVEENIAELELGNPRATIYFMNILPVWTDASGDHEQDKSNIRAAIEAACASTGITCWDTYSTPWITVADTSDGVHPTVTGNAKIAAQVLLRIETSR